MRGGVYLSQDGTLFHFFTEREQFVQGHRKATSKPKLQLEWNGPSIEMLPLWQVLQGNVLSRRPFKHVPSVSPLVQDLSRELQFYEPAARLPDTDTFC